MKKEFVNPTMRFSFFSRENIVTDSTTNVTEATGQLSDAMQQASGGSVSEGAIKTVKLSELQFTM